jgi:hypothetical protein
MLAWEIIFPILLLVGNKKGICNSRLLLKEEAAGRKRRKQLLRS